MNGTIPAFELFNEIGIINQLATRMFERVLPGGMSLAQFTVLNHFVRLGHSERSPAELASAFQVTRPTMSSTLARMEKSGLIVVRPDPSDGRGKRVSLTKDGLAMRDACMAAASTLFPIIDGLMTKAELDAILPPLARLRKALDDMRNHAHQNS